MPVNALSTLDTVLSGPIAGVQLSNALGAKLKARIQ